MTIRKSYSLQDIQRLLGEARRNPEQNPKVSINKRIREHLENAETVPGTNVPNSFVSFTSLDKLGINPGSRYDTPLGIYSYPSFYIQNTIGDSGSMSDLPFVGNAKFANVFSVRGTVLDLSNISSGDLSNLYERISDMFVRYMGHRKGSPEWKESVDFLEMEVFDAATTYAKFKSNGGLFWWVTMEMSAIMMGDNPEMDGPVDGWNVTKGPVSWNKVFREIGIDGCIDSKGEGIIHTSEKTQAVFFSRSAIAENNRYYNKYAPDEVEDSIKAGEAKEKEIQKAVNGIQDAEEQNVSETQFIKIVMDYIQSFRRNNIDMNSVLNQVKSTRLRKAILIASAMISGFAPIREYISRAAAEISETELAEV